MVGIFSIPSTTSKALAKRLGSSWFKEIKPYKTYPSTIIRWGTRATGQFREGTKVFNKASAIEKASNKHLARMILHINDIPVPEMNPTTFPIIGRPTTHTQGQGFFYCKDEKELIEAHRNGSAYFSGYYPKVKEYRVHCSPKKIIATQEKVGGIVSQPIWNHAHGFFFRYVYYEYVPKEMRKIARRAVEALGLDFGAVDILHNPDSEQPYVVSEVNTSPALSPLGIEKYTKFFTELLRL